MRTLIVIVLAVLAIGYYASQSGGRSGGTSATAAPAVAQIDKSESMQAERRALVQRLVDNGVFTKIEQPGNLVRAFVGPSFYAATIDQKQSFASVVYAYWYSGSNSTDTVRLFDGRTGKEIGRYPNAAGQIEMF